LYAFVGWGPHSAADPSGDVSVTFGTGKAQGKKTETRIYLSPIGSGERFFFEWVGPNFGLGRLHNAIRSGYVSNYPSGFEPMSDSEGWSALPGTGLLGGMAGGAAARSGSRFVVKLTEKLGESAARDLVSRGVSISVSQAASILAQEMSATLSGLETPGTKQIARMSGQQQDELRIFLLWSQYPDDVTLLHVANDDDDNTELQAIVEHPDSSSLSLSEMKQYISSMEDAIKENERKVTSATNAMQWIDYMFSNFSPEEIATGPPTIPTLFESRFTELQDYVRDHASDLAAMSRASGYLGNEPLYRVDFLVQLWAPDVYLESRGRYPSDD
jgi:hypothetical protein